MSDKDIELRLKISPNNNEVATRFALAYKNGIYGKSHFLIDVVSCGMLFKELGLLDLINTTAIDPNFNALSIADKRSFIKSLIPSNSNTLLNTNNAIESDIEPIDNPPAETEQTEKEKIPDLSNVNLGF